MSTEYQVKPEMTQLRSHIAGYATARAMRCIMYSQVRLAHIEFMQDRESNKQVSDLTQRLHSLNRYV